MLDRKEETLPRTIQKILNECERDKLTDICKEQSLAEKNAEIISCTDPLLHKMIKWKILK